ncbi:MAG: adenosine deaminase, partial [Anaerolineae bacterium]|nr:adenosine deaminase [Anaerolineae bacterium]
MCETVIEHYERLPKVELHLHLEGAIPLPALWSLIRKYGGDPDVPDLAALQQRFAFRDFPHFLSVWNWKNRYVREAEDFALIAAAVAQDLVRQNVRYVEAFYSPSDFAYHGLSAQEITLAIRRGLDRVPEVEVALIADLVRNRGPVHGMSHLAEIAEVRDAGVIGIGIGGAEHDFPPEPFGPVYARARALGLRTTAHAGEAAGPLSVWGALRSLCAERIGHGTRAEEDPALIGYLAERQIPLEMCPLSNVRTGVVPSLAQHPIRRYVEAGLLVTVNTDDPKMFGNCLAEEYAGLESVLGLARETVHEILLNGIRGSWLPEPRKEEMLRAFAEDGA